MRPSAAPGGGSLPLHLDTLDDDPFPSLFPAALLFAGALFGGLRAILASPLRAALLADAASQDQRFVSDALEAPPAVAAAATWQRGACVLGAVLLGLDRLVLPEGEILWFHVWGLLGFGWLTLEAIPSLCLRGRLLGLVLPLLPLAWGLAGLGARGLGLGRRLLRRGPLDATVTSADRAVELRAVQLLQLAHAHRSDQRLGSSELKMIGKLLDLPETDAAEVMTPRTAISAVPADASLAEALELAAVDGHSRLPVYDGDLDHVLGVFHIKDVLGLTDPDLPTEGTSVRQHMRPAVNVPETVRLPSLLEQMQAERVHLAIVVDEYGGTAGVVTIEDLLEEIVGDIQDEHDSVEDQPKVHWAENGELVADGAYGILDLNEAYQTALPEDESYETLAGLLFDRLGHIPSPGETLELPTARLEVLDADDRRVQRVRVERLAPEAGTAEPDAA